MQDDFFLQLIDRLWAANCPSVITGGLACVEFGLVEHTADCDVLCRPDRAEILLKVLSETEYEGIECRFRGSMSVPLVEDWLDGGWTSHFSWEEEAFLDVFGAPPMISNPWSVEAEGPYASRDQVARMKRTRRMKDWGQATALGLQLLQLGDERGWLHLFDSHLIQEVWAEAPPPAHIVKLRPGLQLGREQPSLLNRVVRTEIEFWSELDKQRIRVFTSAVKPYAALVRRHEGLDSLALFEQNEVRRDYAQRALPKNPITPETLREAVEAARNTVATGLSPEILNFLPDIGPDFTYRGESP